MGHAADVPEITPTELKARFDRGDIPAPLDVREPHEHSIIDLRERGVERAVNLRGGVLAWRQEVDPTLQAYRARAAGT